MISEIIISMTNYCNLIGGEAYNYVRVTLWDALLGIEPSIKLMASGLTTSPSMFQECFVVVLY